jgi:hypothetical protein
LGRPGFLGLACGIGSELLNDKGANGGKGRKGRVNVKYGDWSSRLVWIAAIVQPCIGAVSLGMAFKVEYFDDPIPDRFALKDLFDRHTLMVSSLNTVERVDSSSKLFDRRRDSHLKSSFLKRIFCSDTLLLT